MSSRLSRCDSCQGVFGKNLYPRDFPICRLCKLQKVYEERLTEATNVIDQLTRRVNAQEERLTESTGLIDQLTRRVNAQEEFIATNFPPQSSGRRTTAAPEMLIPLYPPSQQRGRPSTPPTLPAQQRAATAQSEGRASTNSLSLPRTLPDTNIESLPQSTFLPVRNGCKPATRRVLPVISVSNKFQILTEPVSEPHETRLVGDSIIRQQHVEFCSRAPSSRKRFCIPGAGLDDIMGAAEQVTAGANNNTLYVFHAGTNDISRTRSEALLEKYRTLIRQYRMKSSNIIISGILPRISAERAFYNKAYSVNNRLKSLCLQENVNFINTWDHFYKKSDLFANDGLHLNPVGSARLGRLLSEAVNDYWTKNGSRPSQVPTT